MQWLGYAARAFPIAIVLYIVGWPVSAQERALSHAEALALLAERDGMIIELQHTVRALRERLDAIERDAADGVRAGAASPQLRDAAPELAAAPTTRSDPTQLVVDEEAAERALERTLVQTGALLLPRGRMELVPTFSYGSSEVTLPVTALVDDTAVLGSTDIERTTSILDLSARIGLPGALQVEIGVPYVAVNEVTELSAPGAGTLRSEATGRGTGDFRIGLAKTLMRERGGWPDIVGRLSWRSGEGDHNDDGVRLGFGFEGWSGSLSFIKRHDPLAFFWSLAYAESRERDGIEPGDQASIAFGTALAVSPGSSLFGSISYRSTEPTEIDSQRIEGSDFTATSLNLGMTTILRRGTLLNVFTEIGISATAPDYALSFSLPMRR